MYSITYKINGVCLKELGIIVSQSSGLTDLPKAKESLTTDWPDNNGIDIDLTERYYNQRDIKLNCIMRCDNEYDFISKSMMLNRLLSESPILNLTIEFDSSPPLIYIVYLSGGIIHTKKWRNRVFYSTFAIDLVEPEPMKISLLCKRCENKTIEIRLSTEKSLNCNLYLIKNGAMNIQRDITLGSGRNLINLDWRSFNSQDIGEGYVVISGDIGWYSSINSDDDIILIQGI